MGVIKTEIHTEEQNTIALYAKALGHPARVAILEHILEEDACICGEIVDKIGLAQSTISQHLQVLKKHGLIKGSIEEKNSLCYCIDRKTWREMQSVLGAFIGMEVKKNKNC